MIALLSLLTFASAPTLNCETLEVSIPAEEEEAAKERPKGFAWEGFDVVGVLQDGRMVLSRHATLENLSRKALKLQTKEGRVPDRVTEIILLNADGSYAGRATIPRGTLLELHGLPDGGMAVARTFRAITVVDHIDEDGTFTGTVKMPENPQADKYWRKENPLRATGPAHLTALSSDRVISWHAGQTVAYDLKEHLRLEKQQNLYPLGMYVLRGRRDQRAELLLVDRNRTVMWLDQELEILRTLPCESCRVIGLDRPTSFTQAEGSWTPGLRQRDAAIAQVDGRAVVVRFIRRASKTTEKLDAISLPAPEDGAWTWRLREGPWGSALVSISAREQGAHQVFATQKGEEEPVWSWNAPADLVRAGESVVADALGPYVRLRIVSGQGKEEVTRLTKLIDPRSDDQTDWTSPNETAEPLDEALSSPWVGHHFAGDVVIRRLADPITTRMDPGTSVARFERCLITLQD